ncbi:hypothetical protein [Alicyclobacillus sp. SO9]|uniref:hypothetical protein n=1 Tax=Alicyclobacillus sp. SO9 TaxID=2665646 RepID=UPI0018E7721C|nr:hypothetical protein [Alicyclobacillus sp. SO9]
MYLRSRRQKFPVTAWLIPLFIVLIVFAALYVDFRQQHRSFMVFGQSIDAHNIRQLLVQPKPNNPTNTKPNIYFITAHNKIVKVLEALASAQPTAVKLKQSEEKVIGNLYIEFKSKSWHLRLLQASLPNQLYLQYNGRLFKASSSPVLSAIKQKS